MSEEKDYGAELLEIIHQIHEIKKRSKHQSPVSHVEGMVLFTIKGRFDKTTTSDPLGVKVSDITKILKIQKPATSKALNSLESKGFIERTVDKEDRRGIYVKLTDLGLDMIEILKRKGHEKLSRIMKLLGEDDAKEFIRIGYKVTEILRKDFEDER